MLKPHFLWGRAVRCGHGMHKVSCFSWCGEALWSLMRITLDEVQPIHAPPYLPTESIFYRTMASDKNFTSFGPCAGCF